jgi:cytochrome c oxidase subunit IV
MTQPTQARFPRIAERHHEPHVPSQLEYVRIAVLLAVITFIEVLLYYFYGNVAKALIISALVMLAAIKFMTVAAFFMHLRFDGRLLVIFFVSGLVLAGFAFSIVILTVNGMP